MSLSITKNYSAGATLTQAQLDAAFNSIETKFNSTLILGTEIGTGQIATANIAASAVTTAKINDGAVTYVKLDSGVIPAGTMWQYAGTSAPTGWLECDGSAVSRSTYSTLFSAISTTWGTGDGSTTFNVSDMRGRVPMGKGTGGVTTTFTADAGTDILTLSSNIADIRTGQTVTVSSSDTLPAGLSGATTYYAVRQSATTVKLATSLANAIAATPTIIDLTTAGTGTHTLTVTLTARTTGTYLGIENYALAASESGTTAHNHSASSTFSTSNTSPYQNTVMGYAGSGGDLANIGVGSSIHSALSPSIGTTVNNNTAANASAAHPVIQPSAVLMYIIKT